MAFAEFMRGAGLWLSKTLLVLFMVFSVMIYTGGFITSESFLRPVIQNTISSQFDDAKIAELSDGLIQQCNSQGREIITFPLDFIQSQFDVNCTRLRQEGSKEARRIVDEEIGGKAFDLTYNKEVCKGSKCFELLKNLPQTMQSNPLEATSLISKDFHDYIQSKFYLAIGLTLLFAVLVLVFAKGIGGKLMSLGGCLLTSGLPYFSMPFLKEALKTNLPANTYDLILSLIIKLSMVFLWIFIAGAVLFVAGLVVKFSLKREEKQIKPEHYKAEHHKRK